MKIITGASKGIGKYLFEKYTACGESVYGTYLSTIPRPEYSSYYARIDISNYSDVYNWIKSINLTEKIELLNCAAINYNSFAHKAEPDYWARTIEINLIGTFNVIRAVLPVMRKNNYGRIINFSSVVAQSGVPGTSSYAASKAGLWGLTKALAVENASLGITINNLNLGYFQIGMGVEIPIDMQNKLQERIPTKKFGEPLSIYNAVNYLIENSYVNGTSIDINGGLF
jgi:NAD(P)-dependent dehydrogenase (short-subunit alcohol dehydrogenase family)